ncbi:hypothetical protein OS189_14330 [Sulfitobacter sp. F26169L]|nr:hypothetical protein [Sulfitobacter sp. F26169L]
MIELSLLLNSGEKWALERKIGGTKKKAGFSTCVFLCIEITFGAGRAGAETDTAVLPCPVRGLS